MIKVEAIVREERLEDAKDALMGIGVRGLTVSQVMGCGTQMGYKRRVRGTSVSMNMLPEVKLEIVVSTEEWAGRAVKAIREAAHTGEVGDGKIFTYQVDSAVRIRTGGEGGAAIQPGSPVEEDDERPLS